MSKQVSDLDGNNVFDKLLSKRTLFLKYEIDVNLATELIANMLLLDAESNKEITLYINSVGGSVADGLFAIYDTMQMISSPIKTICLGQAFSSAAIILASGSPGMRFCSNHSSVMIHGLQIYDLSGDQKSIKREMSFNLNLNNLLMNILSKHCNQTLEKIIQDCQEDKFLSPQEAINYGLVDHILPHNKPLKLPNGKKTK